MKARFIDVIPPESYFPIVCALRYSPLPSPRTGCRCGLKCPRAPSPNRCSASWWTRWSASSGSCPWLMGTKKEPPSDVCISFSLVLFGQRARFRPTKYVQYFHRGFHISKYHNFFLASWLWMGFQRGFPLIPPIQRCRVRCVRSPRFHDPAASPAAAAASRGPHPNPSPPLLQRGAQQLRR